MLPDIRMAPRLERRGAAKQARATQVPQLLRDLVVHPSSFDGLDGGRKTEDECRHRRPSSVFRLPKPINS
jgi:hypothetical protein